MATSRINGTIIYEPRGRAREYAPLACNIYRGCDHGCTYCYAPSATFRQRQDFVASTVRADFLGKLEKEATRHQHHGLTGKVLLCFTCDPYQHLDTETQMTRHTIKILHSHGFNVQVLTKGGSRALRDLDLLGPDDAFATSMTLLDEQASLEWEPEAALPQNRIDTLRIFHKAGIPTWVSLEPVIDPEAALEIIHQTHEFVDLYKVGKLNHHPHAKTIDWQHFAIAAVQLLSSLDKPYYVKADLRAFLPEALITPENSTPPDNEIVYQHTSTAT